MSFMNARTPENLVELEKTPAFKRQNIDLAPVKPSNESNVSRYTLGKDDKNKGELGSSENNWLHNKPD